MEVGGAADKEESSCKICGSADSPELLVTCSKCLACRKHTYCIEAYSEEVPETWFCEACKSLDGANSTQPGGNQDGASITTNPTIPAKSHEHSGQQTHTKKWQAPPPKVMEITLQDVVRLSNREKGKIRGRQHPNAFIFSRRQAPETTSPSPASGDVESTSGNESQGMQTAAGEMTAPDAYAKEHLTSEVRTPEVKVENTEDADLIIVGCPFEVASKCNKFKNILPQLKHYRRHLPAKDRTWQRGFKYRESDTDWDTVFYGFFKAHSPCILKRKAYKFSKDMPYALKIQKLPHFGVLEDIFQNGPDLLDIALYFFPSKFPDYEESRQKYALLVDLMLNENLMLRCDFGDVELLVFTSKQLNDDSKGKATSSAQVVEQQEERREVTNLYSPDSQ